MAFFGLRKEKVGKKPVSKGIKKPKKKDGGLPPFKKGLGLQYNTE